MLAQHPAVQEAVVVARDDIGEGRSEGGNLKSEIQNLKSSKRLVAYLVADQQSVPSISELRSFLSEKLPDYMLPSCFVFLDALPLTSNGKVDRRALPVPDQTRPDLEGAFVAPRSPVEKELVRIWSEVLKLEQVGIYDNFFELGGHSLLATQVISRIRVTFRMELPLHSLFEKPTIEELAGVIEETLVGKIEKLTEEDAQEVLKREGIEL